MIGNALSDPFASQTELIEPGDYLAHVLLRQFKPKTWTVNYTTA